MSMQRRYFGSRDSIARKEASKSTNSSRKTEDKIPIKFRDSVDINSTRRPFKISLRPWETAEESTASQKVRRSNNSSQQLKKKEMNKVQDSIDQARKATEEIEPSTEASEIRFRIPKASTGFAARLNQPQLDVSNLRGEKWQAFAKQTMQDVISPKAFEQWSKDQTIPKTPNDSWSASDMRKAHTFKKRQWKLSKPVYKSLKLDAGSLVA